jgi:O-methyltransferase
MPEEMGFAGRARTALSLAAALRRALFATSPQRRESARFGLVERFAHHWGFEMYNHSLNWLHSEEFWIAWRSYEGWRRQRPDRKYVIYEFAKSVRRLAGETAECGVLEGASSFLMCHVLEADGRAHHVFDSFEGLSAPEAIDAPLDPRARPWAAGELAVPLEDVRRNLRRFPFVEYHRGWIPAKFPQVADRNFRLVHVDVDLYQPTVDSLAFFYERMVPGGILICDDYGFSTCPGATRAFDEVMAGKPEGSVINLPTGQGYIIKA